MNANRMCVALVTAGWWAGVAAAQPVPDYDFQWSTVGNVGNAPYTSANPDDANVNGRGRVDYEFRVSRLEITTNQWMEFINTFAPFSNSPLHQTGPARWGAERAVLLPSGNWQMALGSGANTATLPIGGVSWRDAARYCNWLHNNKAPTLEAISTGAYDTSTWGYDETTGRYTDARDRMPGAKFFLPSIDEYLKATHYDPNRFGPGQGGYWEYKNMSSQVPLPGLPGEGTTNAGYQPGGDPFIAWNIPLGAYTNQQSVYGLWDTSGGGKEWLESFDTVDVVNVRPFAGSFAGMNPIALGYVDNVGWISGDENFDLGPQGLSIRIYSTIPSPGVLAVGVIAAASVGRRARRQA
jgi:formylglycine-generating enzyme required for sulfatase activity